LRRWLALALLCGCAASEPPASSWIMQASALSDRADDALNRRDLAFAQQELEQMLLLVEKTPDVAERRTLLEDTYYRLARVELLRGRPTDAVAAANEGLKMGRERDLFTANLLIARGGAYEALGQASAAVADYHDALLVNEGLLRQALGEP